MQNQRISRRNVLAAGGATLAGVALSRLSFGNSAAQQQTGEEVLAWVDQPAANPVPQILGNQPFWEDLRSWVTPNSQFFSVAHYGQPTIDVGAWRLEVTGAVRRPLSLSLDQIKARQRRELSFTLECSGNTGLPFLWGAIGNAVWTGTPLAALLREAGVTARGSEVVFWGSDAGEETIRELKVMQNFARSMTLQDALSANNLLCYEMNGAALPAANGFPLRLIAPGWYGIAAVKWLKRIEVRESRLMNRFMARDYVTIRKEERNGEILYAETPVGKALLKSAPGRVVRSGGKLMIQGAAWGAPIQRVEVKIDDGAWQPARLDVSRSEYSWRFWTLDWPNAAAGEHSITSRAIDTAGNVQPSMTDPVIANKQTYWESNGQITRRVKI